jgi:hypothetical protein
MSSLPVLQVFRRLMKRANSYAQANGNYVWANFVRSEFRRHKDERDATRIDSLKRDAAETLTLFDSIHEFEVCMHRTLFTKATIALR